MKNINGDFEVKNQKQEILPKEKPKIVIMLDLQGTLNGMTDEFAEQFMKKIDYLRVKFEAQEAIIFISTLADDVDSMMEYIYMLRRNRIPNVILGKCFYLNGWYDPGLDISEFKSWNFNDDKLKIFEENYLDNSVRFFAIIDDNANLNYAKKCQFQNPPMVICCPSQGGNTVSKWDNLMCYYSSLYGFCGVNDCLEQYIESIKEISRVEIFKRQKTILFPLQFWEVKKLCVDKQFSTLLRYVNSNILNKYDYSLICQKMKHLLTNSECSESDRIQISNILRVIENGKDQEEQEIV